MAKKALALNYELLNAVEASWGQMVKQENFSI